MDYKTKINDYGEECLVPVINRGDIIEINMDSRDDEDLFKWLTGYDKDLIVEAVDYDDYMVWVHDCEYGIDLEFVSEVKEGFY